MNERNTALIECLERLLGWHGCQLKKWFMDEPNETQFIRSGLCPPLAWTPTHLAREGAQGYSRDSARLDTAQRWHGCQRI